MEIRQHFNCSHCLLKDCQWQGELQWAECMCPEGMELAADNITCMGMACLCPGSGFLGPWPGRSYRALGKMPAVCQAPGWVLGRGLEVQQGMLCLQGACRLMV